MLYWWSCVLLVVAAALWWRWADYVIAGGRLPGPRAWPLVGNLSLVSSDTRTLFATLLSLHETHGRLVRFWLGPKLVVMMTDPPDIQAVLGDPRVINRDYHLLLPLHKLMGDGLLSNRGAEWLANRKTMNEAFNFSALEKYVGTFALRGAELVDRLDALADGRSFDPLDLLGRMAVESVRDTVFGTDVEWPDDENIMDLFTVAGRLVIKCALRPWLMFESVFRRTEDGQAFFHLRREMDERVSSVLTRKMARSRESPAAPTMFVDALIRAAESDGARMSVSQLQMQLNHLLAAAIDTTSTALANFLSLMGIHPEIQQQVADELEDIFGGDLRPPTSADLRRMKVTERCLKEALRLMTVAPWNTREIEKAVTLPGGQVIPAGATVVVNGYAVHRDPRNYPEPDRYWPDRWLEENHHPYAFVAFGGGRRNCIGHKYAWLQMKTAVSCVLRRFRVTSSSTVRSMDEFRVAPILRPLEGYRVALSRLEAGPHRLVGHEVQG